MSAATPAALSPRRRRRGRRHRRLRALRRRLAVAPAAGAPCFVTWICRSETADRLATPFMQRLYEAARRREVEHGNRGSPSASTRRAPTTARQCRPGSGRARACHSYTSRAARAHPSRPPPQPRLRVVLARAADDALAHVDADDVRRRGCSSCSSAVLGRGSRARAQVRFPACARQRAARRYSTTPSDATTMGGWPTAAPRAVDSRAAARARRRPAAPVRRASSSGRGRAAAKWWAIGASRMSSELVAKGLRRVEQHDVERQIAGGARSAETSSICSSWSSTQRSAASISCASCRRRCSAPASRSAAVSSSWADFQTRSPEFTSAAAACLYSPLWQRKYSAGVHCGTEARAAARRCGLDCYWCTCVQTVGGIGSCGLAGAAARPTCDALRDASGDARNAGGLSG